VPRRPTVAVIGLGLVGGSVARALTAAGYRVTGIDWPLVVRRALRTRAIAAGRMRAEAAAECDVVVLAAPPATNLRLLRRLARVARPGLVLTDVSSVKGEIAREATRLALHGFVGGHPMAGSEKRGFAASSAALFQGRPWWIVPARDSRATRIVRELVRAAGARPITTDPATHDRTMAFLSHGPQVVSWAILDAARKDPVARRHLRQAGPGFRDMTRLARSPRPLWREILASNRTAITRALAAVTAQLRGGAAASVLRRAPGKGGSASRRR
jgi:prephenate dehydrogenase